MSHRQRPIYQPAQPAAAPVAPVFAPIAAPAPAPVVYSSRAATCDTTSICELQDQILIMNTRIDGILNVTAGQNSLYALRIDLENEAGLRRNADTALEGRASTLEYRLGAADPEKPATIMARIALLEVKGSEFVTLKDNIIGAYDVSKGTIAVRLADMEATKAQLLAILGEYDAEKGTLSVRLDDLEGKAGEFDSFVVQYGLDKDGVLSRLDALESKAGQFDSFAETYQTDKDALSGRIGALETKAGEFDSFAETYQTDKDALSGRIGALETKAGQFDSFAEQYQADKDVVGGRLDALESKAGQFDGFAEQYETDKGAVQTEIDGLKSRLSAEESASTQAASDINALRSFVGSQVSYSAPLSSRVSALEATKDSVLATVQAVEAKVQEAIGSPATDEEDATGIYLVRDETITVRDQIVQGFNALKAEVNRERLFAQEITLKAPIPESNVTVLVGNRLGGLPILNGSKASSLLALALSPYGVYFLDSSNGYALSVTTFDLIAPVENNRLKIGVSVVADGVYTTYGIDADAPLTQEGGAIALLPFNPMSVEEQMDLGIAVNPDSCFTGHVQAGKFVSPAAPGLYLSVHPQASKVVKVRDMSGVCGSAEAGIYAKAVGGDAYMFVKCVGHLGPLNPMNSDFKPLPQRGYRIKLPLVGAGWEQEYGKLILHNGEILPYWEVIDEHGLAAKIVNGYIALEVDGAQDVKVLIEDGVITSEGQFQFGEFAHAKNLLAFKHAGDSHFRIVELKSSSLDLI